MDNRKEKDHAKLPSIIRSSAAEYLTFITATGDGGINAIYADENVWLSQKMIATLYNVGVNTINYHLKKLFRDSELEEKAVIRDFRITAQDGKNYNTKHYNLKATIAVGNKVDSPRAVQFRKWANDIIEEYTIKGFAMDDERLKNSGTILTKKYFEEQLQRIREIRLSERKFYQKITDIYATAIDYDKAAKATRTFFSAVQNKLHWAIHQHTAAELVMERANAEKRNMGLETWKDSPHGKIQKFDVFVAKNYLRNDEINLLERYVSMYLDYAEVQAQKNIPMTMEDWAKRLDAFLEFNEREILKDSGKVTAKLAKVFAETEFEKYRIVQDTLFESDFDKFIVEPSKDKLETEIEEDQ